jgi:hypothetical protein
MCVTDCGVGFEEEGESGPECECGLSEAKKGGQGHLNQPLRDIVLAACCEHAASMVRRESRSVALTEGSARTFGWQRSIKFL